MTKISFLFFSFLFFSFLFFSFPTNSFALKEENKQKLHFDLPKEDPKEQCDEIWRLHNAKIEKEKVNLDTSESFIFYDIKKIFCYKNYDICYHFITLANEKYNIKDLKSSSLDFQKIYHTRNFKKLGAVTWGDYDNQHSSKENIFNKLKNYTIFLKYRPDIHNIGYDIKDIPVFLVIDTAVFKSEKNGQYATLKKCNIYFD